MHLSNAYRVKEVLYSGPKLVIKSDGIKIRKKNRMIRYSEIRSVTVRKAHLTRGWPGLILGGILLVLLLLFVLYLFVTNVYDLADFRSHHIRISRRGSGIVLGLLIALPVYITFRVSRYFTRPLMLIIKWEGGEFRMKFSELGISVAALKGYLAGKVEVVSRDA